MRAQLNDPRKHHLVCPVAVLASWSRDLLEAFDLANECSFSPNAKNLMRMLERQGKLAIELNKEVKTLRHRLDDFESDVKEDLKAQSAGVVKVVETNNSLMQEDHVRLKQQVLENKPFCVSCVSLTCSTKLLVSFTNFGFILDSILEVRPTIHDPFATFCNRIRYRHCRLTDRIIKMTGTRSMDRQGLGLFCITPNTLLWSSGPSSHACLPVCPTSSWGFPTPFVGPSWPYRGRPSWPYRGLGLVVPGPP